MIILYLHLFIDVYWITKSPVVEGEVKVDTSASVVCLSHPEKNSSSQILLNLITQHVNALIHLGNNCAADINDEQRMDQRHFMGRLLGLAKHPKKNKKYKTMCWQNAPSLSTKAGCRDLVHLTCAITWHTASSKG